MSTILGGLIKLFLLRQLCFHLTGIAWDAKIPPVWNGSKGFKAWETFNKNVRFQSVPPIHFAKS